MATVHDSAAGTSRTASKNATRRSMDGARTRDRARNSAYQAGLKGWAMPWEGEDDELLDLYNQGQNDAADAKDTKPAASSSSTPTSARSSSSSSRGGLSFDAGQEAAALLLSLFVYALLANYIKGGRAGVTTWLGAKFLNKGTATSSAAPNPDHNFVPDPGAGPNGTDPGAGGQSPVSPPSSEGYGARVPAPGAQLNQPPPVPPGWQNPFGQPGGASDPNQGRWH